jgi:hypothetical protein
MEEPIKEPTEYPKDESILDKKNKINFDEAFDYKPLKKGFFAKLEDTLFKSMRGKKKVTIPIKPAGVGVSQKIEVKIPPTPAVKQPMNIFNKFGKHPGMPSPPPAQPAVPVPPTRLPNGQLPSEVILPKTQQKFAISSINKVNVLINGVALLVFVVGAFIIYSELPTKPELVAGIVLIAAASGVIANNR